jgi:hydrogenase maturation protease HycI
VIPLPDDIRSMLRSILADKTLIMGVGNILRGDDAFGPELVNRLRESSFPCIDAGTTPENQIGASAKHDPLIILIADAVHMELEPGTCRILERDEILANTGFTTHDLSQVLFMERLEETTGARVLMLAVQPGQLGFGTPMSAPVQATLEGLEKLILEIGSDSC